MNTKNRPSKRTRKPTVTRLKPSLTKLPGKSYQPPDPIDFVMSLMAIPGKSGEETAIANFVKQQLLAAGADPKSIVFDSAHLQTPLKGAIGNLIFQLPGTKRSPRRLFMAHLDTVPTCLGAQPVRHKEIIKSANPHTGVGADNRAGVAVVLLTALRILAEKPDHHPATFFFPIQEEVGLFGARYADHALLGKPKLAFNWDGSLANAAIIGATGGYRLTITIYGQASHAGVAPEQGVSAIAIASLAIAELHKTGWHGKIIQGKKMGTSNVGVIQGGDATNVVTDRVQIRAEARSHDAAFRKKIVSVMENAFKKAVKQVKNDKGKIGRVEIEGRLDYEAFVLPDDEPCVVAAVASMERLGLKPVLKIANGGLDANWMSARGIHTVTMGCGQRNPHMVTEELNLEDFRNACAIAWELATQES